MAGLNPLPTYVHHNSRRLTHLEAHTMLSTFLSRADIDPAYRPDSTLTERGPQSSSTGGTPNLTLHNLKRILKGMEGKRVGGAVETNKFFTGDGSNTSQKQYRTDTNGMLTPTSTPRPPAATPQNKKKRRRSEFEDPNLSDSGPGIEVVEPEGVDQGWQEKDDYELAQDDTGVDKMNEDRHPGADLEQPNNEREAEEMVEVEIEATGERIDPRSDSPDQRRKERQTEHTIDKKERKKDKQKRHKEDKAKRAEERALKKS